jgi:hypothetical protein
MTGSAKGEKRKRPEDGGMEWHADLNAFECLGCGETIPVWRRTWTNPEALASMRELLVIDHTECWEFNDARMAQLQRQYRKRLKREKNLAAQRTGWRGAR